MKKISTFLLLITILTTTGTAGQKLVYQNICAKTKKANGKFTRIIKKLRGNTTQYDVKWNNWKEKNRGTARYTLDKNYGTITWRFTQLLKNTDYTGIRRGKYLYISGKVKGKTISKKVEIDEEPFFNNPSIGLQKFVKSGKETMEFFIIHPFKLSSYRMKAINEGIVNIQIKGKTIKAYQIKWRLTGLRALFYSTRGWFRVKDGVFIKSAVNDGEFHELK